MYEGLEKDVGLLDAMKGYEASIAA